MFFLFFVVSSLHFSVIYLFVVALFRFLVSVPSAILQGLQRYNISLISKQFFTYNEGMQMGIN